MIGNFEVISASSPHIYHSALVLAPKESIVWKLYEQHAHPLIRVVWGTLVSNTVAKTYASNIDQAVCSPCNGFIAIALVDTRMVDILDSITLQHLQTLESPQDVPTQEKWLAFSPDSCILSCSSTGFGSSQFVIVSWDLQTGGIVSVIRHPTSCCGNLEDCFLVYLTDGNMLGFSHQYLYDDGPGSDLSSGAVGISIFDVAAGIHICSHFSETKIQFLKNVWVHGGSLQFATADQTTITIWEVSPTLGTPPKMVGTSSAKLPDSFDGMLGQPLPTSYQFVCTYMHEFQVWDAWNSKFLLKHKGTSPIRDISFSPGGHFLACSPIGSQIHLWKESSTGYILHGKFPPIAERSRLCFSPDGKSIVTWGDHVIQLWHTECSITPPSTQGPKENNKFVLDLSLDTMVAVIAMFKGNVVTVLDLEKGIPQLTIDVDMDVLGLGVIGSVISVICEKGSTIKVVTWDIPRRDCVQNTRVSFEDSSGVVELETYGWASGACSASISPDSQLLAVIRGFGAPSLYTYNLSTGREHCRCEYTWEGHIVQFSPDGGNIWSVQSGGQASVWFIGDKFLELEGVVGIGDPPDGYPWASPHGYQVTHDWWILDADGKRLLMLPPHWQSDPVHWRWKGQFLALLHGGPPEAVILDLGP